MIKVLMTCHGNICRSPMAHYVFRHMTEQRGISDKFIIDSAATSNEEIGNGVHRGTRNKLSEEGIYCGGHKARRLVRDDYERYDYLIGMDRENMYYMKQICGGDPEGKMYALLSFAGLDRDIADPWYTGNFDATFSDVCMGLEAFMKMLEDSGSIK